MYLYLLTPDLNVAVVHQLGDHGHTGPEHSAASLENNRRPQRTPTVRRSRIWKVVLSKKCVPRTLDSALGHTRCLTSCQSRECVVKGHGLDVEGGEDRLLVRQRRVVVGRGDLRNKDDFEMSTLLRWKKVTFSDFTLAETIMHMSQRLTFTARRSSRFLGQPWGAPTKPVLIKCHNWFSVFNLALLTARMEIFGRFCKVFHSLLM